MNKAPSLRFLVAAVMLIALLVPSTAFGIELSAHEISFSKIANARDLGGYKTKDGRYVKKGLILRTAELSYASAADRTKLKKKYHVGTIVDFRLKTDSAYCPDKKVSGAKNVNIPSKYSANPSKATAEYRYKLLKPKGSKSLKRAIASRAGKASKNYTYELVMDSYSQKAYRKYFKYLLKSDKDKAVLFHCVYGKDRTGVAAFMTLIALGVSEKTAYREYTLTNDFIKKHVSSATERAKLGVNKSDLKRAVKAAKKRYGSLGTFLRKAYGLDKAKLKKLRNKYLEPKSAKLRAA